MELSAFWTELAGSWRDWRGGSAKWTEIPAGAGMEPMYRELNKAYASGKGKGKDILQLIFFLCLVTTRLAMRDCSNLNPCLVLCVYVCVSELGKVRFDSIVRVMIEKEKTNFKFMI